MKFYVHCEEPEFTIVLKWDDGKTGSLETVLDIFMERLTNKHASRFNESLQPGLYSSRGVSMDLTKEVSKQIRHLDDIYVKFADSSNKHSIHDKKEVERGDFRSCQKGPSIDLTDQIVNEEKNGKAEISDNASNKIRVIEEKNSLAIVHIGNEKYRNALYLYDEILELDKTNRSALKGKATCYFRANRYQDGLKAVETGLNIDRDDLDFLFLKGKLMVASGNDDNAIETLISYCKLARQKGTSDKDEKHAVQVLLAKAYLLKHQKDMAINILQGILRENQTHVDALAEYASLIFPLSSAYAEEAVHMLLTLLAKHPNDRNIKQKFANICTLPDGMLVLKSVAESPMQDVAALVFLATNLRDCGAVTEALELMERALDLNPSNSHTLLTCVHMLELIDKNMDGISKIKHFADAFPGKRVGGLTCALVSQYLSKSNDDSEVNVSMPEESDQEVYNIEYTNDEKYLLAVLLTLVKLLYIKAELIAIPPILALLKPYCKERDLHLTNIRNEAAYYSCIAEVFDVWKGSGLSLQQRVSYQEKKCVYFLGDSHCIPPAWEEINLKGVKHLIYPVLSTGTKIWHLRPESNFYPKTNFYSSIKMISDKADVITCFGEIDCREALLVCWEKARYDTIEEGMEAVIKIYIRVLKNLRKEHHWNIYVHPVVPVLDLTRPVVMQFNNILERKLENEPGLCWLNFVEELLTENNLLKEEYKLDGTHLHPSYVTLIEKAICLANQQ